MNAEKQVPFKEIVYRATSEVAILVYDFGQEMVSEHIALILVSL